MISIHVTYTVKPEFLAQNKQNISTLLADLKKLKDVSFFYNVYTKEDDLTFVHASMYADEDAQQKVINSPSFIEFQKQRDASGLDNLPKTEVLNLLGSSLSLLHSGG